MNARFEYHAQTPNSRASRIRRVSQAWNRLVGWKVVMLLLLVTAFAVAATFTPINSPTEASPSVQGGVPAKPTGLIALTDDGEIGLFWDDPADSTITGYDYAQSTDGGSSYGDWQAMSSDSIDLLPHQRMLPKL